uniref:Uncharacterized protein n=1 Tax=Lepeophtheirus salmonis TaxID=72036 RepID=A0A0K2UFS1_LEPSM
MCGAYPFLESILISKPPQ